MKDTQLKLLTMQSEFHRDCNTIIDLIAPIVCDKKITKREIDKANQALFVAFGEYGAYRNDAGELVLAPKYSVHLSDNYGSRKLNIYRHDRLIQGGERTHYMHEYTRTIYLDGVGISHDGIMRCKLSESYMPTEKQIVASYAQYEAINAKIDKLVNKRSELPFHYYFDR